jgi:hypothetical protein
MTTISRIFAGVALVMGLTTVGAMAQPLDADILPDKGTREIAFSGQFKLNSPNIWQLSGRYGQFIDRSSEIGADVSIFGGSDIDTGWSIGAFYNYHFHTSGASYNRTLPYVGGFLGFADPGGSGDNITAWGLQAGLKYFLNEHTAFFGELNWRDFNHNIDNQTSILLGLSIFIR